MALFLEGEAGILQHFQSQLASIRTGRVNASILDNVQVEAYGTMMGIRELATVTSPETSQLLITPFDKSVISAIEKALLMANLGAAPVNDGAGLRLSFPPMTEENRKARTKEVDKLLEEARILVRQHRQDALKKLARQEEAGEMGEDDRKRAELELQKEVDTLNKKLEEIAEAKKEDLMKL